MDSVECLRSRLLNVCDDREVQSLAAALDCRIADLYEAVAFVGDRLCCIRAHIEKRVAANVARRTGIKLAVVANG